MEKTKEESKSLEEIKDSINELDKIFSEEEHHSNALAELAELDLSLDLKTKQPVSYTTDLLGDMQKISPTLTTDQLEALINYIKGGVRPDFMDTILTQTNEKLTETLKVVTVLQLTRLPLLYDYLTALQKNMLDPNSIKDMTYEEISKEAANIQKEISDMLSLGLKVATTLSPINQVPTKVEKLASALLGVSESTRQRIEEIIASEK